MDSTCDGDATTPKALLEGGGKGSKVEWAVVGGGSINDDRVEDGRSDSMRECTGMAAMGVERGEGGIMGG